MPGQKTDDSAPEMMEVTPWWDAYKSDKTSSRRLRGVHGIGNIPAVVEETHGEIVVYQTQ